MSKAEAWKAWREASEEERGKIVAAVPRYAAGLRGKPGAPSRPSRPRSRTRSSRRRLPRGSRMRSKMASRKQRRANRINAAQHRAAHARRQDERGAPSQTFGSLFRMKGGVIHAPVAGAAITAGGRGALPRHRHAVVVVTHSCFRLVRSGVVGATACACGRRRFGGCCRDRMGGCTAAPREHVARARGQRRRRAEEQRRFRQWCHGRPLCFAGSLPPRRDAPRLPIGGPSSQ